jgi:DNA-binding transcriptional MerR regulator
MEKWEIGDVVARSGFPASTIRYYEQIELLPPAERVNGRRRYDESILKIRDYSPGSKSGAYYC